MNNNNNSSLVVGSTFTIASDYTSPIGCFFRAGHRFTIVSIGEVHCWAQADICGSLILVTRGQLRDAGIGA